MRKLLIASLIAFVMLTGCQQTTFEPHVEKNVEYLEMYANYDPLTLIKDTDNAGLIFEVKSDEIDTSTPGTYNVTYTVRSANKRQSSEVTFSFDVADQQEPTLTCPETISLTLGNPFNITDYASATDPREGDVSSLITYTGTVNGYVAGTYGITVIAADSYGNTASQNVKVTVSGKTAVAWAGSWKDSSYTAGAAPSITLSADGSCYMTLNTCSSLSSADGFWAQKGDKLYITSETFSFSTEPEKNVLVLQISNDGNLIFDSEVDYCAPVRGDIFTR
jgi:hypothetical protein